MARANQAAAKRQTKRVPNDELAKRRKRFLEIASGKLGYSEEVAREAAERAVAASCEKPNHSW